MPKLPKDIQQAAEEAEERSFGPLEPGTYICKVREIDTAATTRGGDPKWVFQFDTVAGPLEDADAPAPTGRLWEHAALTANAAWKIKQIFAALGFTLDSDADELVGEYVKIVVIQEEITTGQKAGQMGNSIQGYIELTDDEAAEYAACPGANGSGSGWGRPTCHLEVRWWGGRPRAVSQPAPRTTQSPTRLLDRKGRAATDALRT